MRVEDQGGLFSYISTEARVPASHPLRKVGRLVRDVLGELNRSLSKLCASEGRPSIAPEQLLSALLLHAIPQLGAKVRPFSFNANTCPSWIFVATGAAVVAAAFGLNCLGILSWSHFGRQID